ncbi:MAG: ribosome-associated translation inhibitor RaiA [Betaproteobacteria bacterium]|nr:ribosome-associated translation inhibitor RaiA [Betaproteobacteria bacterium]
MQTPLQITFRDVPHSDAMETHIREKAAKLESLFSPIMACHVKVELPHKHKHQGKHFCVSLDVRVPGAELVVNHHRHEDAYIALRDAFDAAKRQLEDHHRRVRGGVKHHAGGRALVAHLAAAETPEMISA